MPVNSHAKIRVYAYVEETKPDGTVVMHGQGLLSDAMPDVERAHSLVNILAEHVQCVNRMLKVQP